MKVKPTIPTKPTNPFHHHPPTALPPCLVQFVPFNCMYEDGFDHFDNLVLCTMVRIPQYEPLRPLRDPQRNI